MSGFNLFDFNQTFVPKQPVQPTVQPVQKVPQKSLSLFSDEERAYQKMLADGLSTQRANDLISQRRKDIMGDIRISQDEASALLKMRQDGVSSTQAVDMLKQRRKDMPDNRPLWQKAGEGATNFLAGNLNTVAKYGGNILDLATFGLAGFGEDVKQMEEQNKNLFKDSTAYKVGSYLPDVAMSVAPLGKAVQSMSALKGGALVGAGFGALQPALEKGTDATLGDVALGGTIGGVTGAIAGPVLTKAVEKGAKYGTALVKGGIEGLGKSVSRDVSKIPTSTTKIAEGISTRANRFNALDEQKFLQATGETPGEFAVNRGMNKVGDDAVAEATSLFRKSMKEADDAFATIKGRFTTKGQEDDILGDLVSQNLKKIEAQPRNPDKKRVIELYNKYQDGGLTATEINEAKRIFARNNKFTWDQRASDAAVNATNLQNDLRKWQQNFALENGFDNIAQINKNTQAWKMYADFLEKKISRSSANNSVSITDWIALSGGEPTNIALFLGKKGLGIDSVKQLGIKTLGKQTKPSIIPANKDAILKSNLEKGARSIISPNRGSYGDKPVVGLLNPPKPGSPKASINKPINLGPSDAEIISKSKAEIKPKKINPLDLSKNKKGFINPKAIGEDLGVIPKELEPLAKEARKYKSDEKIKEEKLLKKLNEIDEKYLDASKERGSSAGSMNKKLNSIKHNREKILFNIGNLDKINKLTDYSFHLSSMSDGIKVFYIFNKNGNNLGSIIKEDIFNGIKIKNFIISENYRGKGDGAKIINELKNKYDFIKGDAVPSSIGFWEKMGAKFTGKENHLGYKEFIISK